nr:phosphatase PAP2 family protein [Acidobacteriota bacterium]
NISIAAVAFASAHTPLTYDYSAYALDANLGFPPFLVGRWFVSCPVLFACCAPAYNALPLYLSLARAVQLRFPVPGSLDLRLAYAVLGTAGFALYQVCPVAGPLYRFGAMFPFHPPFVVPLGPAPLFAAARNGMPSLHFGWVLLVFCYCRSYRRTWIALLSGLFLILTALATLGSGEHYLVDLLVAIPLVCAVYGACSQTRTPLRWGAVVGATMLTLFCLVTVRTAGSGRTPDLVVHRR